MARQYVYNRSQEEKRKINSARQRRYRQKNLLSIKEHDHRYYAKNREKILASQKAYRDANRTLLKTRRYIRYYSKKGWSQEDIKKIIKKKLNINADEYESNM